jgi:RES domain-containing protein
MVYASESIALAALETLVHYDESLGTQRRLVLCRADIPADIPVEDSPASLYTGRWASYPAPRRLARFGDKWAREGRSVVLRVRSAVSPREKNFLLNPNHPLFSRLHILIVEPFRLDRRLP